MPERLTELATTHCADVLFKVNGTKSVKIAKQEGAYHVGATLPCYHYQLCSTNIN